MMEGYVQREVIHNTDLPTLVLSVSNQVMDYENEKVHLVASGESSEDAKESMLWMIKQLKNVRDKRGV